MITFQVSDQKLDDVIDSDITSLPSWPCERVADWLKSIDMAECVSQFEFHQIDGNALMSLGNEQLKVSKYSTHVFRLDSFGAEQCVVEGYRLIGANHSRRCGKWVPIV